MFLCSFVFYRTYQDFLVEKEMQIYKIHPNERPKHLELLYKALKTIKPTSVESERAFSAMGFFVTKIRSTVELGIKNNFGQPNFWFLKSSLFLF